MNASDWIAIIMPVITLIGAVTGAVVKLTQLIDAVKGLGKAIEGTTSTLADHEGRIRELEHADPSRRHRA